MGYYPVFLDLRARKCVVIGQGAEAERKALGLMEAGAVVTLVGADPSADLDALAAQGKITLAKRSYGEGDLEGAFLAIAATPGDAGLTRRVAAEAKARGVLLNAMDRPGDSGWIAPAQMRRGDLTIAISTNGRSPAMARLVKEELERTLPNEYGPLLDLVSEVREELRRGDGPPSPDAWQAAMDRETIRLLSGGDRQGAKARLLAALRQPLEPR